MGSSYVTKDLEREQRVREQLFDVLREFPVLYQARQGVGTKILNPFASLERVVRSHVNPLILYLHDLIGRIKAGLPYLEAMEKVILFALRSKYRDRVKEAVSQLGRIEANRPYFLWGLASFLNSPDQSTRARTLRTLHKKLHALNKKYGSHFKVAEGVDLIPWRMSFRDEGEGGGEGSYEYPSRRQLEVFRQACLALGRLMMERGWQEGRKPDRIVAGIKREMLEIARVLFDYGFTVEEICGRARTHLSEIVQVIQEAVLDELESTTFRTMSLNRISRHMVLLTLLDYESVLPFRTHFRLPSDTKRALEVAHWMEREKGQKGSQFRRIINLSQKYRKHRHWILHYYLDYLFSKAHGEYQPVRHEEHFGVELAERFVLRYYDDKQTQLKAEREARKLYSSKTVGEMLEVLRLLIEALSHPERIGGRVVQILGPVQSGAMGRVLIGILKGNIVALKEPSLSVSEEGRLSALDYEARILGHVQAGTRQHENIVEYYGVVRDGKRRFLAIGYHPAETLSPLIKRARLFFSPVEVKEARPFLLEDVWIISTQLFNALLHLKSKKVVHRDLKPSNLLYLVDQEGKVALVKIIDFGVAKGEGAMHPRDIHENRIVGTLGYMAPELVVKESSYASDLYSLGAILYQLLSGRQPLRFGKIKSRQEIRDALRKVYREPRPPLREANSWLKEDKILMDISALVDQMLAMDAQKRPSLEKASSTWRELWGRLPDHMRSKPLVYSSVA